MEAQSWSNEEIQIVGNNNQEELWKLLFEVRGLVF